MTRKEEAGKPENSSMAKNPEEVEKLGREMEKMATNRQVKKQGKTPDPEQYREK